MYVEKLQNENENMILLSNLKGILLSIIQKGYVKMILDLTRSYHTICSSIEDWHLLLILDELQAAYKSILSLFQLTRVFPSLLSLIQIDFKRRIISNSSIIFSNLQNTAIRLYYQFIILLDDSFLNENVSIHFFSSIH